VDAFAKRKRRSGGPLPIETYPEGYVTPFERIGKTKVAQPSLEQSDEDEAR
jgi:hypothetical protein